jgi:conjugal transfer/entry exclusion protein
LLLNQTEQFGEDLAALKKTLEQTIGEFNTLKELKKQFQEYCQEAEKVKEYYKEEIEKSRAQTHMIHPESESMSQTYANPLNTPTRRRRQT